MNALILVDLQKDFAPGGALPVPDGDAFIPRLNEVQRRFDLVVATQDWHPPDHGSFAANHPGRAVYEVIDLNGLDQTLWPVHCVRDTPGADFIPSLDASRIARVFRKGTDPAVDSYSGFFDNGRRHATGLDAYLRERTVETVYVCGLATDYCVKATALDARRLGLQTHLLEDLTRGVDVPPGAVARAIADMRDAGVHITRSDELLKGTERRR
jgi:nicotinamidase/pyrazinamidase